MLQNYHLLPYSMLAVKINKEIVITRSLTLLDWNHRKFIYLFDPLTLKRPVLSFRMCLKLRFSLKVYFKECFIKFYISKWWDAFTDQVLKNVLPNTIAESYLLCSVCVNFEVFRWAGKVLRVLNIGIFHNGQFVIFNDNPLMISHHNPLIFYILNKIFVQPRKNEIRLKCITPVDIYNRLQNWWLQGTTTGESGIFFFFWHFFICYQEMKNEMNCYVRVCIYRSETLNIIMIINIFDQCVRSDTSKRTCGAFNWTKTQHLQPPNMNILPDIYIYQG